MFRKRIDIDERFTSLSSIFNFAVVLSEFSNWIVCGSRAFHKHTACCIVILYCNCIQYRYSNSSNFLFRFLNTT